ncbi:MAG: metallophosphoesterase family protein [Lactobacillaceae bacterium]|jgi:putative phosphoesterase|nr:metallophosphoesterase family protein [Lactobacillaceae bacterium]
MKIAIVSDSHGNATALEAVINDALAHGATEFWSLGDIALTGPGSQHAYELLNAQNTTHWIKGNWEDTYSEVMQLNPDKLDTEAIAAVMQVSFDEQRFTPAVRQQIAELPYDDHFTIGPLKFALYHNAPGNNRGKAVYPSSPQAGFDQFMASTDADVIVYAHTHQPLIRYTSAGQMIINPGSVGQPYATNAQLFANQRASYILLEVDANGIGEIDFRRVDYDRQREIDLAYATDMPYAKLYQRLIETGHSYTHEIELLEEEATIHGYADLAKTYLTH